MKISEITPLVLTYNEAPNIVRCLDGLRWADRVVVVDSHSSDETIALCEGYENVETIARTFDDHTAQWNFGIAQCQTPWVLSLDADYVLSDGFEKELETLAEDGDMAAYSCRFLYCIYGRPLRGTLYPPRLAVFRKDRCRYVQDGHTQDLKVDGRTGVIDTSILHDDRKAMTRWCRNQIDYARLEADKLSSKAIDGNLGRNDRLRAMGWLAPFLILPYCLFVRRGIFDGWQGWFYALQRLIAEVMLALFVVERKISKSCPEVRSLKSQ